MPTTIQMVFSGGQTGVDIAALVAAWEEGIPTGGWAPKGWETLRGPNPELGSLYGLREAPQPGYRFRTWLNVRDSSATLQIVRYPDSPGMRCTGQAIRQYQKPTHVVHEQRCVGSDDSYTAEIVRAASWVRQHGFFTILNVAGNDEERAPGIQEFAHRFLRDVFARIRVFEGDGDG